MSHHISPIVFAAAFRDVIRVGFNWERFYTEKWPIEIVSLTSPESLARCFAPWYIGPKGEEVAYDDADAVPMSLADVPKAVHLLNEDRRADIQRYVDSMRKHEGRITFIAPTYALPDDQHFVLDRNHRLSALTMFSLPFEVLLWNVRGPLDSDCLLDLIHWLPPRKANAPQAGVQ